MLKGPSPLEIPPLIWDYIKGVSKHDTLQALICLRRVLEHNPNTANTSKLVAREKQRWQDSSSSLVILNSPNTSSRQPGC